MDLDAKRLETDMKKTERELQWQHEKFEVDMRLQQRKLELEENIARENKELEEGKVSLQMTLNDKEQSRQHDLNRLRIEHCVPLSDPAESNEDFKLASAVKFDNFQVDFYLQALKKPCFCINFRAISSHS